MHEEYKDCFPDREIYDLHRENLTNEEFEEETARIREKMRSLKIAREMGVGAEDAVMLGLMARVIESKL